MFFYFIYFLFVYLLFFDWMLYHMELYKKPLKGLVSLEDYFGQGGLLL